MAGKEYTNEAQEMVEKTLEDYGTYVNEGLARMFRFLGFTTLEWENFGAVVKDIFGKEYIDCGGYGVFFHGHRHPKVVAAVKNQLEQFPLSNRLLPQKPVAELARLLAEVTPGNLQYSFFCNSGAEAVEGALKLARAYTLRSGIVSTYGAFHGKTFGSLSASGRELYREPFYPLLPGVVHVPFGDLTAMEKAVNRETAAVILEPIQGEGGVLLPPDNYLNEVRDLCDRTGALLVLDEVQTGIGRTGKMFACEHWHVTPDIICMAKSLGGGVMPIGAFTTKKEIFEPFNENPYLHSSTFGGNPLACAAGYAAIETILQDGLLERAARLGDYAISKLNLLKEQFPRVIADVRGKGLLIGIELEDEGSGGFLVSRLLEHGVIVVVSLNKPKVIRFMPPAIISDEQLDFSLSAFAESVSYVNEIVAQI
ncbi:MAG: aspartate aminotransferase family protein [Bacillota bacterium]